MFFLRRPRLEVTERCVHGSPKRCLNSLSFKRQSQLVTRSCRHKVNSSPVNSSHTCLVTQSTRHKRAHNKSASRNFFYLHSGQVAPRNSAEHGRRHYGNNAGWIKMALGMEVGFGPGHIVLDGTQPPPQERADPLIFGPHLLWPNGCIDQDATWYGGRPPST